MSNFGNHPGIAGGLPLSITPLIAVKRKEHHPDPIARFTEPAPLKEGAMEVEKMRHFLLTMAGRALYAKRKCTVEPVFGIIKAILGFRQFSLRGVSIPRQSRGL